MCTAIAVKGTFKKAVAPEMKRVAVQAVRTGAIAGVPAVKNSAEVGYLYATERVDPDRVGDRILQLLAYTYGADIAISVVYLDLETYQSEADTVEAKKLH